MNEREKWRSAIDEPPLVGEYVLVFPAMRVAVLDEEGVYWFADTRVLMDVTHWRMLPFPPYTDGIECEGCGS